ncbi:hypothetical protein CBL_09316 [Carabus blaptoides fortunei]
MNLYVGNIIQVFAKFWRNSIAHTGTWDGFLYKSYLEHVPDTSSPPSVDVVMFHVPARVSMFIRATFVSNTLIFEYNLIALTKTPVTMTLNVSGTSANIGHMPSVMTERKSPSASICDRATIECRVSRMTLKQIYSRYQARISREPGVCCASRVPACT